VSAPAVALARCPCCEQEVPDANFCGVCGLHLVADPGEGRRWWRRRAFAAEPGERVLRPHVLSTLFPQLPRRSRPPFLIVGAVGALALVASALARLPAAGITVAALGLPLLFVLYLGAADIDTGPIRRPLMLAALLGAGLGVAWVLVSGALVSRSYGVPVSVGLGLTHLLGAGLAIPAAGMVLMTVPVIVARLRRDEPGQALDGVAIGALGALAFAAAATLSRLAPQLTLGLFARHRPLSGVVVESVLTALTIPVTAAVAGATVGLLLWFSHPAADPDRDHPRRVRRVLALLTALALLAHALLGMVDISGLPQLWAACAHLLITALALVGLRVATHLALLHEGHDPVRADQPILCEYCEHVVPDTPFCPACGVAARAASRASLRRRRGTRPQARDGVAPGPQVRVFPGFAVPAAEYLAPPIGHPRLDWLLSRWGAVVLGVVVLLGGLTLWLTPKVAYFMCPPDCGRPPTGTPVTALPRFATPEFSVAYPAAGSAYRVVTGSTGVTATYTAGDGGVMQLVSEPANGRSAREVVTATLRRTHPDARFAYELPNAMVGYQPGYGAVADDWPQSTTATFRRDRILVMAAVRDDVALIAFATGPYRQFGPDVGPGLPSGANLEIAMDLGKYVNSFRWAGDPLR
jgi:hypothetical protein